MLMELKTGGSRMEELWEQLRPWVASAIISIGTAISGYVLIRLKWHGTRVQTMGDRLLAVEDAHRKCQETLIETERRCQGSLLLEQKARADDVRKLEDQNAKQQREIDKLTALLGGKA